MEAPDATRPVTLRLPRLYDKQRDAFFHDERYGFCEACPKAGKTVGGLCWLLDQCARIGGLGRNFWWIEPTLDLAKRLGFDRLTNWLRRADPHKRTWSATESNLCIQLANGSKCWFKTGEKPDHLYGEDVWAVVMDEVSRCREAAWIAVRSTLTATRGKFRGIGNVRGRGWAWKLGQLAKEGAPGFRYTAITADDAIAAGVIDAAEIEDQRRIMPHDVFRELYYLEPSDDGGNPFGLKAIRECIIPEIAPGPPVAWGFDLAKAVDWTVGVALSADGSVCGLQRWQSDWRNTLARVRAMVKGAPALVDATGVGDPIVEELRRHCPGVQGYTFTSRSKQTLMEGLAVAIQGREVRFPDDGPLVGELEAFEREYTATGVRYQAPENMHDDCVDALALAVEARRRFGGGVRLDVIWADDEEPDDDEWESGF